MPRSDYTPEELDVLAQADAIFDKDEDRRDILMNSEFDPDSAEALLAEIDEERTILDKASKIRAKHRADCDIIAKAREIRIRASNRRLRDFDMIQTEYLELYWMNKNTAIWPVSNHVRDREREKAELRANIDELRPRAYKNNGIAYDVDTAIHEYIHNLTDRLAYLTDEEKSRQAIYDNQIAEQNKRRAQTIELLRELNALRSSVDDPAKIKVAVDGQLIF